MSKSASEEYDEQESQKRFEAALKGALKTPHKPLKAKPRPEKTADSKKNLVE